MNTTTMVLFVSSVVMLASFFVAKGVNIRRMIIVLNWKMTQFQTNGIVSIAQIQNPEQVDRP